MHQSSITTALGSTAASLSGCGSNSAGPRLTLQTQSKLLWWHSLCRQSPAAARHTCGNKACLPQELHSPDRCTVLPYHLLSMPKEVVPACGRLIFGMELDSELTAGAGCAHLFTRPSRPPVKMIDWSWKVASRRGAWCAYVPRSRFCLASYSLASCISAEHRYRQGQQ